jgi:hypothetical protein
MSQERSGVVTLSAILCLIFGVCCAGGGGVMTGLPILMREITADISRQMRKDIPRQLDRLKALRERTSSPQKRAEIDNQIGNMRNMQDMDLSAASEAILPDSVMNCAVFEGLMALTLNILLFIAGCGMFKQNPWARKLGLWSAAIRLATVVLFLTLLYTVAAPAMEEGLVRVQTMFGQSGSQQGVGKLMSELKSYALLWGIFSCTVPIALLIMLNTRAARDAFGRGGGHDQGFEVKGGKGPHITMVPR